MAIGAREIGSFLRFVGRRGARERQDEAAIDATHWARSRTAGDLPAGLSLQWLGTSGFRLAYEGHTLLIDPYFTRLPVADLLRRRVVPPSPEAAERALGPRPRADAVLIGHTHFDHVLDAPLLARRGARVYGSHALMQLMSLYRMRDRAVEVDLYRAYDIGPFRVTFVPSRHSKLVLGLAVPFDHGISCEHFDQLAPSRYGCGQVFGIHIEVAGVSFYHQGSADLIDEAVRHRGVDFFLAGIAGRAFSRQYTARILGRLRPRVVVPHHYDDFFRPLSAAPGLSINVDYAGFVDEVREFSRDIEVRSLRPLETVGDHRASPAALDVHRNDGYGKAIS